MVPKRFRNDDGSVIKPYSSWKQRLLTKNEDFGELKLRIENQFRHALSKSKFIYIHY